MPLVERDQQLATLHGYAAEALVGEGRLVLVAGEAGAGKTALVEALAGCVTDRPWWWSACDGLATPSPLGPVGDLAAVVGGDLAAAWAERADPERIFAALLSALGAGPAVLVVEDLHWADEATLDLLRRLARRVRLVPALVLVTYRDDAVGATSPLRRALGDLAAQRGTRRMDLPLLTRAAVAEMAAAAPEGAVVDPDELHRLTGGNPFFLTEVLATRGRDAATDVPRSVRDAVLARVATLPQDARGALDVAALAGARVEGWLLEEAAGVDGRLEPAVLDAVAGCGALTGDASGWRFRHELARMAVAAEVPPHRRTEAHRRLLAALARSGLADDARLAHHAEGAGDVPALLHHARRAGATAAALGAHREALAQYRRAARHATDLPAGERAALLDALAEEAALADAWEDAAAARTGALDLWRAAGDVRREGDTLRHLSRAMWRLCRGSEARAAAEAALDRLEPLGDSAELAWALAAAASNAMVTGRAAEAVALAGRARAVADRLDLPEVISDALNTEACSAHTLGLPWESTLRRALDVAVEAGTPATAARAWTNLHSLLVEDLRLADAEQVYRDGTTYCDEHDIATFGACLRGEHAGVLELQGEWPQAVALSRRLLQRSDLSAVNRLHGLLTLGRVLARRDEDCRAVLDEALASAQDAGEPQWVVPVSLARTEAAWLEGDPAGALVELERAERSVSALGPGPASPVAGWAHRLRGRTDLAAVGPHALEVAGDPHGAAAAWDALGCPYAAALALLDATDLPALREAVSRLDHLGAGAAARVARDRLRTCARASGRAARDHPAGLTAREQEVLVLLCEGCSNDEIAARLVVSPRTVHRHVSAVLAKLGVPSRGRAADLARRTGLVPAGGLPTP